MKVNFKLNGIDLTIDAPEGAKPSEQDAKGGAEILFDKDSALIIGFKVDAVTEATKWWKDGKGYAAAKRFLIEEPESILVESDQGPAERRFVCLTEREVGGVKYVIGLARPNSGRYSDLSTKAECLLALKCAKTLALK